MKVIIVDDLAEVRDFVQAVLEMEDFEIVGQARDGVEAVRLAKDTEPDAVVIDVSMPRLDGVAATRLIKERFPDMAVIALSSSVNPYDVRQMVDAGAQAYIGKTDIEELTSVLARLRSDRDKGGLAVLGQSVND